MATFGEDAEFKSWLNWSGAGPYVRSTDQLRSAGQWIVGVVGGLAAILVAGLPFADLGSLIPFSWRTVAACAGVAVGLWGLGSVLVAAGRLLAGRYISIREVLTHAEESLSAGGTTNRHGRRTSTTPAGVPLEWVDDISRAIEAEKDSLYRMTGAQTVRQLLRMQRETSEDVARASNESDRLRLQTAGLEYSQAAARVTAFADERFSRTQFKRLGRRIVVAVPMVVIGVLTFTVAVNKPTPLEFLPHPLPATIYFTPSGTQWMSENLKCGQTNRLSGEIVGGTVDDPEVAIPPTRHCSAGEVALSPDLGIAVPRQ